MDYCSSCRRTLNGALVCPGCGYCAPDTAPPPVGWRTDACPTAAAGHCAAPWESHGHQPHSPYQAPYPGGPYADPAREHAAAQAAAALFDAAGAPGGPADPHAAGPVPDEGPQGESVLGPASIAPTLHRGRAARRRQMERWKKNRRRAAAATAVALFGGGVTVASMSHSGKGAPAAASAQTPVVPTSLHTDTAASGRLADGGADAQAGNRSGTAHAGATAHRPDVRATYPSTDSIASMPRSVIPAGQPVAYTVTTHTAPVAAPAPSTTAAPVAPSGAGSAVPAVIAAAPSGSPAATTGAQPQQQTQQPAQSDTTAPATPPRQQLCVLIVCLG